MDEKREVLYDCLNYVVILDVMLVWLSQDLSTIIDAFHQAHHTFGETTSRWDAFKHGLASAIAQDQGTARIFWES